MAQLFYQVPGTSSQQVIPQRVLYSTNPGAGGQAAPIRDFQTTTSVIDTRGSGLGDRIGSFQVVIQELRHTYVGDLVISIRSPDGATQVLRNRTGGSANDIINQTFNVSSGLLIGGSAKGDWSLIIEDRAGSDQGYLAKWALSVTTVATSPTVTNIPLTVSGSTGSITDVDVIINQLTTGRLSDLRVELVSPNNVVTPLFDGIGGTGARLVNTVFDQESSRTLATGGGTFTNSFQPIGNLTQLAIKGGANLSANGIWYLRITDRFNNGNINTVVDWGLRIRTNETFVSTIAVDEFEGAATDVELEVRLVHPVGDDLRLSLTSPWGQTVVLPVLNSWNNQILSDDWLGTLNVPAAGLGDFFLSGGNFTPRNPVGEWKLNLVDLGGNSVARLQGWSLKFASSPTEFDLVVADLPRGAIDVNVTVHLKEDPLNPRPLDLSGLDLSLRGPNGETISLFQAGDLTGGSLGTRLLATTFSDASLTSLANGIAPYSGTIAPRQALSIFGTPENPVDPNGSWTLIVTDRKGNSAGLIDSWSLSFAFSPINGQAMRASVVGDVNADGLEDLGFVVRAFVGEEEVNPAVGRAFILPGTFLPNNSGRGPILSTGLSLAPGALLLDVVTSGGTATGPASAILEIGGADNNILIRALNPNSGVTNNNDYRILVRYDSAIPVGVLVYSRTGVDSGVGRSGVNNPANTLTITLRDDQVTANDVLSALQTSVFADQFRARFEATLYTEAQARLYTDSIWQAYGTSIGGEMMALGDINNDGAADFALVRDREDAAGASGGVLVYTGSAQWRQTVTEPFLAKDRTFVRINQASSGQFGSTSIFSDLHVSAGDFNGDGLIDLVVGRPEFLRVSGQSDTFLEEQVLSGSTRGAVYVFFSIGNQSAPTLQLRDANLIIEGQGETDRLGVLPRTPAMDINQDGLSDLFVGGPTANGSLGGVRVEAGRLYLIYGARTIERMPDRGFDIITNRSFAGAGSFLVDTGIGRPDVFYDVDISGDGVLDSSRYTLLPGESSKWYRFTTLGDGSLGDMIRLSPISGVESESVVRGASGVIAKDGPATYRINLSGAAMELQDEEDVAVIEFDLTPYLGALDDPMMLKQVTLRLAGLGGDAADLPINIRLVESIGSQVLFSVVNDDGSNSFWLSDGTPFGTNPIKRLDDAISAIRVVGGRAFVVEHNVSQARYALWEINEQRTDLRLVAANLANEPSAIVAFGQQRYVQAGNQVFYAPDGTSATVISGIENAVGLVDVGANIYLIEPSRLWRMNGATPIPVERSIALTDADSLLVSGDFAFFKAEQDGIGLVWSVKLAGEGADSRAAPLRGPSNATLLDLEEVLTVGEQTYLVGTASVGGRGLWFVGSDGKTFTQAASELANPGNLTALPTGSLLLVHGSSSDQLAVIDPAVAPALVVASTTLADGSDISGLAVIENAFGSGNLMAFFAADSGSATVGWQAVIGATTIVATPLTTGRSGLSDVVEPREFTAFAGEVYFSGTTPTFGRELFSVNGQSISLVKDFAPGPTSGSPQDLVVNDGKLYVVVDDGSEAGRQIMVIVPATDSLMVDAPGKNNALAFMPPLSNSGVRVTILNQVGQATGISHQIRDEELVVEVEAGVTTASDIVAYFTSGGGVATGWTVELASDGDNGDGNVNLGTGIMLAGSVVVTGGSLGSASSLELFLPGTTETIRLTEAQAGAPLNDLQVVLTPVVNPAWSRFDSAQPYHARASWDGNAGRLTIEYEEGVTTSGDVARAIGIFGLPNPNIPFVAEVISSTANFNDFPVADLVGQAEGAVERTLFFGSHSIILIANLAAGEVRRVNLVVDPSIINTVNSTFASQTVTVVLRNAQVGINDIINSINSIGSGVTASTVSSGNPTVAIGLPLAGFKASFSGGVNGVAANGSFTLGADEILITAASNTAALNNVSVKLAAGAAEAVAYHAGTKTITVTIRADGTTTTAGVAALINGLGEFSATGGSASPVFVPVYSDVTADGVDGDPATADLVIDGVTIRITAASVGTDLNGRTFRVVGAYDDGNGIVLDLNTRVSLVVSGSTYTLYALPGTATHDDLRAALDQVDGFSAAVTSGTSSVIGGLALGATLNAAPAASSTLVVVTLNTDLAIAVEDEYKLVIFGIQFVYEAEEGDTHSTIATKLAALVNADSLYTANAVGSSIEISDGAGLANDITIEKPGGSGFIAAGSVEKRLDSTATITLASGGSMVVTAGPDQAGIEIRLNGSGTGLPTASLNGGILTVTYQSGVSTLGGIAAAVDALADFAAVADSPATTIPAAASVTTAGGKDSVAATGGFTIVGSLISVTASLPGIAFNGVSVVVEAGVAEAATYNADTKTLRVTIKSDGTTTTATVRALIDGLTEFNATGGSSGRVFEPTYSSVTSNGLDPVPSKVDVTLPGGRILTLTSTDPASYADFNGKTVSLRAGTAIGIIETGGGFVLTIVAGQTTAADLATELADTFSELGMVLAISGSQTDPLVDFRGLFTAGGSGSNSRADVRAPGDRNDFFIETTPRLDGYTVRFEDGGPSGDISISINQASQSIILSITFGVTTVEQIVAALNVPFVFSTVLAGGDGETQAAGSVDIQGNVLVVTSETAGFDGNGIRVVVEGGTTLGTTWIDTVEQPQTLVVSYIPNQTTLAQVIAAIEANADTSLSASIQSGDPEFVFLGLTGAFLMESGAVEVHDGSGVVNPASAALGVTPTVNGPDLARPTELFVLGGRLHFIGVGAEGKTYLWRQNSGTSSTASALLEIEADTTLRVLADRILLLDSTHGLRQWKDGAVSTVLSNATSFGVLADEVPVVLTNTGQVTRVDADAGTTLSASRIFPWTEFGLSTVHNGNIYLVESGVLWRLEGQQAVALGDVPAGSQITIFASQGASLFFVAADAVGRQSLYVFDSNWDAMPVALRVASGGGFVNTVETGSLSGKFGSFTSVNGKLVYVYADSGVSRISIIDPTAPEIATLVRDLGNGVISEVTAVGDRIFFRFGNARGSALWTSDLTFNGTVRVDRLNTTPSVATANPAQLTALGNRLYFVAANGAEAGVLWTVTTGNEGGTVLYAAPLIDLVESVVPAVRVYLANGSGDGVINHGDRMAVGQATLIVTTTPNSNETLIDVTELIRERLAAGETRVTFYLQLPETLADAVSIAHAHAANGTRLQVVTGSDAAITGSLFTQEGRLLQSDQVVIDLSQLLAGTYFLRIDGPTDRISLVNLPANGEGPVNIADEGPSLGAAKDYLYFLRNDSRPGFSPSDFVLWRTNGVNNLTTQVRFDNGEIISDSTLRMIGGAGDSFFFSLGTGANTVLWEVSGQFARQVGALNGAVDDFTDVRGLFVFRVGGQIFSGNADGFVVIFNDSGVEIGDLSTSLDQAIFQVDGRWWATDGTVDGTQALDAIDVGSQNAGEVVATANQLFYLVRGDDGKVTLWRARVAEGQAFGAEPLRVAALAALSPISYKLLGVYDGRVLFTVETETGHQLWASNGLGDPLLGGQVAGTSVLEADLGGAASFVGIENNGTDDRLYFTVVNANGTTSLLSTRALPDSTRVDVDVLPGEVGDHVVWNGATYFIAGQTKGPFETRMLWKITAAGVELVSFLPRLAGNLIAAGNQMAFTAFVLNEDGSAGPALFVSDGTADGTRMVIDLSPVSPGTISALSYTANGIVFIVRNDSAVVDGLVDYSLWISNGFRDGTYPLLSGNGGTLPFGTATVRPVHLGTVGSIAFYEFQGQILGTDGSVRGTGMLASDINPVEVIESDGRFVILTAGGGLWMSEGNLVGLPFKIEVKAPAQGMSHSTGDRDFIIGGEGNDVIIGNGDHDILFGGGGSNFFVAERKEIRDLRADENFALPPTSEFSVQQPRQSDTEVWIPDVALRAAIAHALGIPVTEGFDGRPVIHGKIMASQMATLVELQAPNAGIQSVVGLHFARNLRVLNLNDNRIGDLSILVPATDPVSGARTGLANLRVFSMDYNGMGILTFGGGDADTGVGEYVEFGADINEIQSTVTFWFRTDNHGELMGLFSMDAGTRGSAGLDRSIFLDQAGNIGAFIYAGADNGYELIRSSGVNFADGKWHHVAYVFSADGAGVPQTLYVDGIAVAVGTVTSSSLSVQTGFNLGYSYAVPSSVASGFVAGGVLQTPGVPAYFKGDMDELRIWDTAFTDVQVNADMVQPYPAERVFLVGYWSFDGPSTGFAIDHSLFGRNGLLGGGSIERSPAFNRMQPDAALRPEVNQAFLPGLAAKDTLFPTIIRDLQRLNVPGPIEKLSLAFTRIDVLEPLSALPDLGYINLTGVVTSASESSRLATLVDHTQPGSSTIFTAKDGTRLVVEQDYTLVLSSGAWAWRRIEIGQGIDKDESFTLRLEIDGLGRHWLHVSAFDVTESFNITAKFDASTGLYDLQIFFDGGAGDDELLIDGVFPITVYAVGGTGNDTLMGGHFRSFLFGGDGNDTLIVGGGYSVLTGGRGDDSYVLGDHWGEAVINENVGGGTDTIDFSAVSADLEINVRGTSRTVGGTTLNTVRHLSNTIERFVGGSGNDILNFHRDNGGILELGDGVFVWDGVRIEHSGIEGIDVRFVNSQTGQRTGVVRVLADQDYTGRDLRMEARSIDIRASIKASGLSLRSDTILGIGQDLAVETGLGRIIVLEADRMRLEAKNGVGDVNLPLFIRAGVIEAVTEGAAGIYLTHLGGGVIGHVEFDVIDGDNIGANTEGLSTGAGGNIHFVNLSGTLQVNAGIQASGGSIVISTEAMEVNATIESTRVVGDQTFRGALVLQSLSVATSIGMATTGSQANQSLHFSAEEIHRFMKGFDQSSSPFAATSGITIGRSDGSHTITLDTFTYTEFFTFRSPVPFGSFDIIGQLNLEPSDISGDIPTLTFIGWRR